MKNQGQDRQRLRALCLAASELVDSLAAMYPATMPALNATDRDIGAHIGTRQLVALLVQLRDEGKAQAGPIPKVLPVASQ